jgi:hypothetical protein
LFKVPEKAQAAEALTSENPCDETMGQRKGENIISMKKKTERGSKEVNPNRP